ncbi:MAG: amino acid permease, partial [Eggerthellaceae bacterium]|nr:amino acid permease [Eggerthellaceae bacterium]
MITACVGSAIFSIPGITILNAGPSAILSWIIGGIILGLYGLQVAELSTRYKQSGGMFVYPSNAINKTVGFFCAWGGLVGQTIAVSFSAIFLGKYLVNYLNIPDITGDIIALTSVTIICMVGFSKLHIAAQFNNVLGVATLLLVAILGYLGVSQPSFNLDNFSNFFGSMLGNTGWIQVIPNAMLAYG